MSENQDPIFRRITALQTSALSNVWLSCGLPNLKNLVLHNNSDLLLVQCAAKLCSEIIRASFKILLANCVCKSIYHLRLRSYDTGILIT